MAEHEFLSSELTQDAVLRNFEVIGEGVAVYSKTTKHLPTLIQNYR